MRRLYRTRKASGGAGSQSGPVAYKPVAPQTGTGSVVARLGEAIRAAKPSSIHEILYKEVFQKVYGDLQDHPGLYIHFGDIAKVGIRTIPQHRDPPGVYFYPVDWLYKRVRRYQSTLYRSGARYYTICRLDLSSSRGIRINTDPASKLQEIADRNGWGEVYRDALKDPEAYVGKHPNPNIRRLAAQGHPGAIWWGVADGVISGKTWYKDKGKVSWIRIVKGIPFIEDTGDGIIHQSEPAQTLAIDPRIIHVVKQERNTDASLGFQFASRLFGELGIGKRTYEKKVASRYFQGAEKKAMTGRFRVMGLTAEVSAVAGYDGFGVSEANIQVRVDFPEEGRRFEDAFMRWGSLRGIPTHSAYTFVYDRTNKKLETYIRQAKEAVLDLVHNAAEFKRTAYGVKVWTLAAALEVLKQIYTPKFLDNGVLEKERWGSRFWVGQFKQWPELQITVDADVDEFTIRMKPGGKVGPTLKFGETTRPQEAVKEIRRHLDIEERRQFKTPEERRAYRERHGFRTDDLAA